jgi:hypothetical protein
MTKKEKIEKRTLDAIVEYLKSIGWIPMVIGFTAIEQGSLKYNFRLIVSFSGRKKEHKNA